MKVRNINGTSDNTCKCGDWLKHWEKYSGQRPPAYCPEEKCIEMPEVGAHVQKDTSTDYGWYIIPLCKRHNGETGKSLIVSDAVNLAPANVSDTCGRR
jgi:hypothetical protein